MLAVHGMDWGVVALHPEQAVVEQSLTDGHWPSCWPGWVGVSLDAASQLTSPSTPGYSRSAICMAGTSLGRRSHALCLEAAHGQGMAQVAAGLTIKAFYLNLSC